LREEQWRQLQPYTVNLPCKKEFINSVEQTNSGVIVLPPCHYNDNFGLVESALTTLSERLIV
ncbi:MAG: hypothetical protein AAFY63_22785, partial [Cyanobacteria bacterium J06643_13]